MTIHQLERPAKPTDVSGITGDVCTVPFTSQRRAIFQLALQIDANAERVNRWYREERLVELGDWTAQELCAFGFGDLVLSFLRQVVQGKRD